VTGRNVALISPKELYRVPWDKPREGLGSEQLKESARGPAPGESDRDDFALSGDFTCKRGKLSGGDTNRLFNIGADEYFGSGQMESLSRHQ
jgi:hypothetical protein